MTKRTAILVMLSCALALRIYNLNSYDLWFDELATNMFSASHLARMAEASAEPVATVMVDKMKNDPHSSFYYLIVYFYSIWGGDGKSLRIVSLVFSVLSLGVFYKLSRLFFDRQVSLYALFLMAINPFHLWYAQEARVYAMACFFSLLASYCYFKVLKTDKSIDWVCFSAASVLAVYSSYYFLLLFFAMAAMLFVSNYRRAAGKWLVSLLIVLISLIFLKSFLANQWDFVKNYFWIPVPTPFTLLFTWKIFALGYTATPIQYWLGLGVFSFLFAYGVFSCCREKQKDALILLLLLFLPIILVYVVSKVLIPVYINRQLIIVSPFYYLFIARGLAGIRHDRLRIAAFLGSVFLIILSLANYHRGFMSERRDALCVFTGACSKNRYSDVLKYLSKEFKDDDLIVTADPYSLAIIFSHILKHEKAPHSITLERFWFLVYPDALTPFTQRFLRIDEFLESITQQERGNAWFFQPRMNGRLELKGNENDKTRFQRIWLMSGRCYKSDARTMNFYQVRDHIARDFASLSYEEQGTVSLELFVRKDLK